MKQEDLKRIINVTAVVAILIWVLVIVLLEIDIISLDAIRQLGLIITTLGLFWAFFFRWGWKWPILKPLFNKPDLNGTWIGSFETDWEDKKGQTVPVGEIVIVIRQTFLFVHFTSFTNRFIAHSYAETLLLDDDRGIRRVVYLYSQNRVNPGAEGDRQGTAELSILGEPIKELSGNFWTNAKSNGFLKVRRVSEEWIGSFEQAKSKWPNYQDWQTLSGSKNDRRV